MRTACWLKLMRTLRACLVHSNIGAMNSNVKTNNGHSVATLMRFKNGSASALLLAKIGVMAVSVSALSLPVVASSDVPLVGRSTAGASLQGSINTSVRTSTAASDEGSVARVPKLADFGMEAFSTESRNLANWIVDSVDNGTLPFMIIDKVQARVFVFNAQGQLRGASAALLGMAIGDDTVPGIGLRKLSSIRPEERTTPAGRFVASLDRDINGEEVLWVDYDSALSLHRMVKGLPKERRAERMASSSPQDNRISFGCINVPPKFYEQVVSPTFTKTYGVVYILPETRSAAQVFGFYDVAEPSRNSVSAESVRVTRPTSNEN